jgi:hypothetical protein
MTTLKTVECGAVGFRTPSRRVAESGPVYGLKRPFWPFANRPGDPQVGRSQPTEGLARCPNRRSLDRVYASAFRLEAA